MQANYIRIDFDITEIEELYPFEIRIVGRNKRSATSEELGYISLDLRTIFKEKAHFMQFNYYKVLY